MPRRQSIEKNNGVPKDATIDVIVKTPNGKEMVTHSFSYHIKNASQAIPKPLMKADRWQKAILEGLRSKYGGQVRVKQ